MHMPAAGIILFTSLSGRFYFLPATGGRCSPQTEASLSSHSRAEDQRLLVTVVKSVKGRDVVVHRRRFHFHTQSSDHSPELWRERLAGPTQHVVSRCREEFAARIPACHGGSTSGLEPNMRKNERTGDMTTKARYLNIRDMYPNDNRQLLLTTFYNLIYIAATQPLDPGVIRTTRTRKKVFVHISSRYFQTKCAAESLHHMPVCGDSLWGRCWGRGGGGGGIVFGVSHILTRPSDSSRCRRRHQGVGSVAHRPAHQERLTSRAAKPEDGRRCPRAGNLTAEGQKRHKKIKFGGLSGLEFGIVKGDLRICRGANNSQREPVINDRYVNDLCDALRETAVSPLLPCPSHHTITHTPWLLNTAPPLLLAASFFMSVPIPSLPTLPSSFFRHDLHFPSLLHPYSRHSTFIHTVLLSSFTGKQYKKHFNV
ncbi:hypothetical protein C0Q70_08741 [Pomacea canaliculata]|uniref:Uncharacterized protein n=1 Tax=Pomacea canaliculata TaxID=400727 RepID=A0A2T7P7U4_POMCA|nr:hypothetical protein C0Q70_08741 [Pomacea canaliculata]